MTWEITYITWIHCVTAIISLQLVFAVYRMQPIRGRIPFLLMMLFCFAWSLILTFESAAPTISDKVRWSEFEYFCNMGIPLFFMQFILAYNLGTRLWIERNFWVFLVIPLITLGLVFTNNYHHLIWTNFSWSPAGNNILVYHHGPVFYIAMAYSLVIVVLSFVLLVFFIKKRPRYYQHKSGFLIAGSFFPLLTGFIYTAGLSPVEGLDISPMGLLFSGVIFFWGISRRQLFDIVPAGHRLMIDTMLDGVIVLDTKNFIMDVNPTVMKMLKIPGTIVGRKLELAIPGLEEFSKEIVDETGSRKEIFLESNIGRWFEVILNPLRDVKEKNIGNLLIFHDITKRKDTELQLKKLADELTEINAMKDRLYSIIGHDLRGPFNSILGFSELLTDSYEDLNDEERKQFATNINIASKGAYELLENLLEWSRIQLGRTPFTPEELNLNLFINEAFVHVRHAAVHKEISLWNNVSAEQVVYADKNMLSTLNEKGTGIGLILCKEFIYKHGGTIRFESQEGKGSRFFITLPIKKG